MKSFKPSGMLNQKMSLKNSTQEGFVEDFYLRKVQVMKLRKA